MPPHFPAPPRGRGVVLDAVDDGDASLIARAAAGELVAFGILYDRYRQSVFRFALARLGDIDDAHDVVQETFLDAMRGLSDYRGDGNFRSWLIVIAYRRICGQYNLRLVASQLQAELPADPACWTRHSEESLDARRALRRCNALLAREFSPLQRQIFQLRYWENRSISHIAKTVHRSRAAVKVGLFRTRQRLLGALPEAAGSEPGSRPERAA